MKMEQMSVLKAVQLHARGKLTEAQVKEATGFDRISEIATIYNEECENAEIAAKIWTAEEIEDEELTALAWELYQPILAEEPGYLSMIVRELRIKKRHQIEKIGAAFCQHLRASRGQNVVPFRRPL